MRRRAASGSLVSRALAFVLASSSIGSLLLYFSGLVSMPAAVRWVTAPAVPALVLLYLWAKRNNHDDLRHRIAAGAWAGTFATLFYDLVRVPIAHSGVPVFKAISYFGTLILDVPHPTLTSEIVGWGYHLSNGLGFAIMYLLLVPRPGLFTAILWGVGLELVMLWTPYAEVFGYRRTGLFLAITVGSHVVYGAALGLAARHFLGRAGRYPRRVWSAAAMVAGWCVAVVGIGCVAADFYRLHAASIPSSPPSYIGKDVFVTWNVPEPDRVGAIWLLRRFEDPDARFHFVEPMSRIDFGTPFDLPEATIRRSQNRSTFEVVVERLGRQDDPALRTLARMCHLTEISPWNLAASPVEAELAESYRRHMGACTDLGGCIDNGLDWFDTTYSSVSGQ